MDLNQAMQVAAAGMKVQGARMRLVAQNLANADTPGYRPQDLRAADFARLVRTAQNPAQAVTLARTAPGHQGGGPQAAIGLAAHDVATEYETAPDGNAVILEEQMAKATETALDFQLTSNLYRKYHGMIRIALGTQP